MDLGTGRIVPRKRRHGNSTDSSIIQFSKPDCLTYKEDKNNDNAEDGESDPKSDASDATETLSWSESPPPPRQQQQCAQKMYERQPRRKMRDEGRVEIEMAKEIARKEEKRRRKKSGGGDDGKEEKKSRKKKSGRSNGAVLGEKSSNILHQGFESQHVTKDRLTVRRDHLFFCFSLFFGIDFIVLLLMCSIICLHFL